jgi:hypothetical protein
MEETYFHVPITIVANFNNPITSSWKFLVYGLHNTNMVLHISRSDPIIGYGVACIYRSFTSQAISRVFWLLLGKASYRNMSSTVKEVSTVL